MRETTGCDTETCPVFDECMETKKFVALSEDELHDLMNLLSNTSDYAVVKAVLGVDFAKPGTDKWIAFERFLEFHKTCTGKKNL